MPKRPAAVAAMLSLFILLPSFAGAQVKPASLRQLPYAELATACSAHLTSEALRLAQRSTAGHDEKAKEVALFFAMAETWRRSIEGDSSAAEALWARRTDEMSAKQARAQLSFCRDKAANGYSRLAQDLKDSVLDYGLDSAEAVLRAPVK